MPQFATVALGAGVRDDGAIGTQEEPAGFGRNRRAWNVLGYSGVKAMRRAGSLNPTAAQLLQLFEQPFEDVDFQTPRPGQPGLQYLGQRGEAHPNLFRLPVPNPAHVALHTASGIRHRKAQQQAEGKC